MKQTEILYHLGIDALNAMQEETIAAYRRSRQLVLLSPTGSGKTLAYLLPLAEEAAKAIILVPSRELAAQTVAVVRQMRCGLTAAACYGGRPAMEEHRMLRELQPDIVVATPGRAADHLRKGNLRGEDFRTLVIDEFDKCLELGFREEMAEVLSMLPMVNRRFLLSATDSDEIPRFVTGGGVHTSEADFEVLDFLSPDDDAVRIRIHAVASPEKDKLHTLGHLLTQLGQSQSIVFVNYRESVERVARYLQQQGFSASAFHGGMEQRDRERALSRFAGGAALTFVSTDLAARGLDIAGVDHVVHYHLPLNADAFTHRNGRTARWDRYGDAWMLIGPEEHVPDYVELAEEPVLLDDAQPIQPPQPLWTTLYIGKGKKDKVNRVDIVGFLSKVGGLRREELGRVDVSDHWAFAAVAHTRVNEVLRNVRGQKLKGQKTIIEQAR